MEEADMKLKLKLEEDEEQQADKEYEEFLRQETERLKLRGFTPRVNI